MAFIFGLIQAIVCFLIRLPFIRFPVDDDFGYYVYPSHFSDRGVRNGRNWFVRFSLPAIYGLIRRSIGDSPKNIRLVETGVAAATGTVLFLVATFSSGPEAGLIVSLLYAFFSNAPRVGLHAGNHEKYYSLISSAAFLGLVGAQSGSFPHFGYAVSGALLGLNVLFKEVLVLEFLLFLGWVIAGNPSLDPALWFSGAFIFSAGIGSASVYLGTLSLRELLDTFRMGYHRTLQDNQDRGDWHKLGSNFYKLFTETAPLWIAFGLLFFLDKEGRFHLLSSGLLWWMGGVAAVFFVQKAFWPYHFIPFIAPLSLGAGITVHRALGAGGHEFPFPLPFLWILLGVSAVASLASHLKFFWNRNDPREWVRRFGRSKTEQLTVVPEIAEYIRNRTEPGDTVYQWGYLYHLYYLADRRCPVRFGLSLTPPVGPWQEEGLRRIVEGLLAEPPKYLVVYLQALDLGVLAALTGLSFRLEKIFSHGIRVYRVEQGENFNRSPLINIDLNTVRDLLRDPEDHFQKGKSLERENKYDEAERAYEETLRINPYHTEALFHYIDLTHKRNPEKTRSLFLRCRQDVREAETFPAYYAMGKIAQKSGKFGPASCYFRKAIRLNPQNAVLYFELGICLKNRNLPVETEECFLRALREDPDFAPACFWLGWLYRRQSRLREASRMLREFLRLSPDHAPGWCELAEVFLGLNQVSRAGAALSRAKRGENTDTTWTTDLEGRILRQPGRIPPEPSPETRKKVLVFRCAPPRYQVPADTLVAKRFSGWTRTLFCQSFAASRYKHKKIYSALARFPAEKFAIHLLFRPSLFRFIRDQRPDAAVIPTTAFNRAPANLNYFNLILYATVMGAGEIYLLTRDGKMILTSVWTAAVDLFRKAVVLPLFMLVKTFVDLFRLWRHPEKGEILSFKDEPNDLTAHLVKARWIKENGVFGVAFDSFLGNPYTLYYPPLSYLLLGGLGAVGYLTAEFVLFGAAASLHALWTGNPYWLVLVPFLLSSWFFRLNTISIGRVDVLGWGFVLLSLASYQQGLYPITILSLSGAVLTHTTVAFLGGAALFLLAIAQGAVFPQFFVTCGVAALLTYFWWVPFLKNRGKFGFHRIWGNIPFWNLVWHVYEKPMRNIILFLLLIYLGSDFSPEWLLMGIPLAVYASGYFRKKYVFHAACLDGAVLTFGTFALLAHPTSWNAAWFLVLINWLDLQTDPGVNPILKKDVREFIGEIFKNVPDGSRVAMECHPLNYWEDSLRWGWSVNCANSGNRVHLLSGVGFDQVDPQLSLDFETRINPSTQKEDLQDLLTRAGCNYVLAYTAAFGERLVRDGYRKVGEAPCRNLGLVEGRKWELFQTPRPTHLIEPSTEYEIRENALVFRSEENREYHVKVCYYPGWKAVQNGYCLDIEDGRPGMRVRSRENGWVTLTYKFDHFF